MGQNILGQNISAQNVSVTKHIGDEKYQQQNVSEAKHIRYKTSKTKHTVDKTYR
jgi:hypothetical protein